MSPLLKHLLSKRNIKLLMKGMVQEASFLQPRIKRLSYQRESGESDQG